MAKFGVAIDTQRIPILGLTPEQGTSFPSSPTTGQIFTRTDESKTYQYLSGGWKQIAPAIPTTWTDVPGKPTTFPPSAHTHAAGDVTYNGSAQLPGSNVEEALDELGIRNASAVGQIDAHVANSIAHGANQITFNPSGGLIAMDVQAAITELDSEKATLAQVTAAVNAVIDGAPGAIDTLNELAAALGDDPNFATTMTNALAGKASTTHTHALTDASITGTLQIGKGGTGAISATAARANLSAAGVYSATSPALTAGTWSSSMTHNLGGPYISVTCIEIATGEPIILDWKVVDDNNVQLRAGLAFAAGALRVLVTGK